MLILSLFLNYFILYDYKNIYICIYIYIYIYIMLYNYNYLSDSNIIRNEIYKSYL